MPVVEDTIDIRAPIDRVFEALTDPRRGPEWNPNIVDVQMLSGMPIGEGTSWRQVTVMLGRPTNLLCRITRYRAPHEGLLEVSGAYGGRIWTLCEENGGVTRVTQRLEYEIPGGALGRMAAGLAGTAIRREMVKGMQRQRETLEREAGGHGGPGTAR